MKRILKQNKRAAIELSMTTIIMIVLGVSMLILGMVLVRSIMCGAIGLTTETSDKAEAELNKLFGSTGDEVVCLGEGGEPVKIVPGKTNIIYCSFKAPQLATYTALLDSMTSNIDSLSQQTLNSWVDGSRSWSGSISPGDEKAKKVFRLNLPDNAPEGTITLRVTISKGNLGATSQIYQQDLDFTISRMGVIKAAMC